LNLLNRLAVIGLLLALLVGLPLAFRRVAGERLTVDADDRLVVISPHNETIRREFARAFGDWWRAKTGRSLYVDWRTPGGTSEIRMVLDAGFKAAAETGREGIGIDVFFGGGEPDFASQAKQGRLARAAVFDRYPEWFGERAAVPPELTGERLWAADGSWVGCCLSQFGIAYNPGVLQRLGAGEPRSWADLGDPRLMGTVALADPTKSGSVARAFELLVQSDMQRAIRERGDTPEARSAGWADGLRTILRMAANARYFTDSASKVPHDIGQGDAAAGMCIDFYGRAYAEKWRRADGSSRVGWIAPEAGGSFSADPVAVLKGAPHPELAQAFVEFCLSPEGQVLWFFKPGEAGGPKERALHRTPIRRDVYTAVNLRRSTLPEVDPFARVEGGFFYRKELTGKAFNTLRQLVKVACIDSHDELTRAWRAVAAAGFPPEATAVLLDVSAVPYEAFGQGDAVLDGGDPLAAAARARELGERFRANFRRAAAMVERTAER